LREAVSARIFDEPVRVRSHGGRVRAIVSEDVHIDVAFIGAPSSDYAGNCNGLYGPHACGCIQYSVVDQIGDPDRIMSGTLRITRSPTRLKIARDAVKLAHAAGYIYDGCSFQAGAGGISLAFTKFLGELLEREGYVASWAMGGTTKISR